MTGNNIACTHMIWSQKRQWSSRLTVCMLLQKFLNAIPACQTGGYSQLGQKLCIGWEWQVDFTTRETEVLKWIATGKSDWQIGQILNISDKTVNFHVENMKRKCGVATRIQVVVLAVKYGAILPQELMLEVSKST